jgi:hypothetical protein
MKTPPPRMPIPNATITPTIRIRGGRSFTWLACRDLGTGRLFVVVAISPSITAAYAESSHQRGYLLITMSSPIGS